MKYISLNEQIIKERQKNALLHAEAKKNAADIDYIAMMCDVELGTDDLGMQSEED